MVAHQNELMFSDLNLENATAALGIFTKQGRASLIVYQDASESDQLATKFLQYARNRNITAELIKSKSDLYHRANMTDGIFLFVTDATELTRLLITFTSSKKLFIWAPRTAHYCMSRPVLVQSVPKCGTHLLFECLKAFGLTEPASYDLPDYTTDLYNGHFYNLQHMPMDYLSRQYQQIPKFVDNLCRSPILFIVRDPRDTALSLAHYLGGKQDYHILSTLCRKMALDEKLDCVITGNYPIPVYINDFLSFEGNITDLFMLYRAWWCDLFSNVWLVRFEELIGPLGGGDYSEQLKSIWGLQLALHVPGKPSDYVPKIFSAAAATFRRGQIGDYLNEFSVKHHEHFEREQELFDLLGYADRWNIIRNIRITVLADQLNSAQAFIDALRREISIHSHGCIAFRQEEGHVKIEDPESCLKVSVECAKPSSENAKATNDGSISVVIGKIKSEDGQTRPSCVSARTNKRYFVIPSIDAVSLNEVIASFMENLVEMKLIAKLERRQHDQTRVFSGEIENFAKPFFANLRTKATRMNGKERVIELVGETVEFNLVRVGRKFFALAKSLGPTELMVERLGERELKPILLVGESLEEIRGQASSCERKNTYADAKLIEMIGGYNIITAGDRFFAVAKKLGPVDLFQERLGERELAPYILTAPDLSSLRRRIPGRISKFFWRVRGY